MTLRHSNHRRLRLLQTTGVCLLLVGCGDGSAQTGSPITVVTTAPFPAATPTATPTPPLSSGIPATTGVVVQAGDSIGAGFAASDYAAIDHLGLASGIDIHNASVPGQWMLTSYGGRSNDLFPFYDPQRTSVLLIQDGTNDLRGGSSAAYLYQNILTPFVVAARKAGFYVAVDTILPRTDTGWTTDLEQQRLAYNFMVRGNGAGADAVNDIAADPIIGDGSNIPNSPFYVDGLHLSVQGQQRLAMIDATTLAVLLQYPARMTGR